MVSGGTYGTESIIAGAGYGRGILVLLFLPVLWCLPTAFMIGELSSALPEEGGYYAWVRRGLGNFWGFQEAWLSLAASIFDMAIYPTLFVFYLKAMAPWFGEAHHAMYAGPLCGGDLRSFEFGGHPRRRHHLTLALFPAFVALRLVVLLSPVRAGAFAEPHAASYRRERRPTRRGSRGHVELHGLGQCLDHRAGSRAPAAHLSQGNDRRGDAGFAHLYSAFRSPCTLLARPPPPSPKTAPGRRWLASSAELSWAFSGCASWSPSAG